MFAVRRFSPLLFLEIRSRAAGTPRRGAALEAAAATPRRDGLGDSREGSGDLRGSGGEPGGLAVALHTRWHSPSAAAPLPGRLPALPSAGAGLSHGHRGRPRGAAGPWPEQRLAGLPITCPAPGTAASRGVELRGGEKRHLSPQGRFEKSSGKRREGTERPQPPAGGPAAPSALRAGGREQRLSQVHRALKSSLDI